MTDSSFESLSIDKRILKALYEEGYTQPTQIQRDSIPTGLEGGDVLAVAPTGTGKTAAFTIPILQHLAGGRGLRALVLTPTRELALQILESLKAYGRHMSLKHAAIMGGVSQHQQVKDVQRGADILVATPGRLLDLMEQGHVKLGGIEVLVLDEADRMLDMGFIHDVKRIVKAVPRKRQTLFFSATMPKEVTELANSLLHHPVRVEVAQAPVDQRKIEQRAVFVEHAGKMGLLTRILRDPAAQSVLVFTRTKHRADRLVQQLQRAGFEVGAIHSNKTQGARQRVLSDFSRGDLRVLVATDIVARGIDVEGITHVINYDLSDDPENHVHRIGRTARAGAAGMAISFCSLDELSKLTAIERFTREKIEAVPASAVVQEPEGGFPPLPPARPRKAEPESESRAERGPRRGHPKAEGNEGPAKRKRKRSPRRRNGRKPATTNA